MTDDLVPFGSRAYGLLCLLLLFSRGMDFLSTWVATPHMVLEGNPIAKKLGWRWGGLVNLAICFGFALWETPAVVISTTSLLVASRNFQQAWLMRSMGEDHYRDWYIDRMQESSVTLYLSCLFGQTALVALVGAGVMYFTGVDGNPVLFGIGLGIIAYAGAVTFFTLLGTWRLRRSFLHAARRRARPAETARIPAPPMPVPPFYSPPDPESPAE